MTPLERITQRVGRSGDVNNPLTLRPYLTLEEFFDGNESTCSICANLTPTPKPAEVFAVLKAIRARPEVHDVRVEIRQFDDPKSWPYSDTVWVITSAAAGEVKSWFPLEMAPDEVRSEWARACEREGVVVPADMFPVMCWWD